MSKARVVIASVAGLGLLAACSSSKSISSASSDAAATTTAPPTSVPDTAAPTTTAVADTVPATDPPAPPACADTSAPSAEAQNVTIVEGDFDGDGVVDSAVSWLEPSASQWFVRSEVSGGEFSTVTLADLGASYAQVLANVDVDFALGAEPGVNRDEILAIVGGGASALNLGIFGVGANGCLFQFDDGAGSPFLTPVGATIRQRSGLMCDGGAGSQFLVALNASTLDDLTWDTVDHRIDRQGDHSLVLGVALEGTLLAVDPALQRYSQAECDGTVYVG